MATPRAYVISQARDWIQAASETYTAGMEIWPIKQGQGLNTHPHRDNIRSLTSSATMRSPMKYILTVIQTNRTQEASP